MNLIVLKMAKQKAKGKQKFDDEQSKILAELGKNWSACPNKKINSLN